MGKIVKTILATEDNDPMGLLGTYDIFTPKKIRSKGENNKNSREFMKREIIYFSAFSMMEPDKVELLENNKASITSIMSRKKIVEVPDYRILNFWDKLDEIDVWKWNKKYPIKDLEKEQLTDGYNWDLKLRNRKGKEKFCSGYMSFPKKFKNLIKELNNLFGSNIRY